MSDALPTPPIPQSPVSNDAFEALIDLLASDGIDDINLPHSAMKLRDSSGKLDFDKIRYMFATQNEDLATHRSSLGSRDEVDGEKKASDSLDQGTTNSSSSTRASSSPHFSPKHDDRQSVSDVADSGPSRQPWILHTPFSFEKVDTALSHAHAEVASLRQKYDELQALVSKRFGRTERLSSSNTPRDVSDANDEDPAPSPVPFSKPIPSPFVISEVGNTEPMHEHSSPLERDRVRQLPSDIDCLSEEEAKHALMAISRALNIAPDSIIKCETPSPTCHEDRTSTRTLDEVVGAVRFLTAMDELVWRRSLTEARGLGSDEAGVLAPTFSTDNTSALLSRLQLWEGAVRGTSLRI